jgi:hypothetical protein
MDHSSVKPQTVMVNNITSHNNMNHSSVKHQTVMVNNITSREVVCIVAAGYIVDHYCLMFSRGVVHIVDHFCLMFDRGVVHIVVAGYIVDH